MARGESTSTVEPTGRDDRTEFNRDDPEAKHEDGKPPGKIGAWVAEQRRKYHWLDHLVVAGMRYQERNADHYAAAITYFSFLALFPLLLLTVSIAGFVLASRPDLVKEIGDFIQQNVPGGLGETIRDAIDSAIESRRVVGGVGLIVLLYSGLGWIGNLRKAVQAMWGQPPRVPSFIKDKLGDLLALACLGVALLLSVGISVVVGELTDLMLRVTGLDDITGAGVIAKVLGILIAVLADMVIFLWLLVNLARRPITYRAVLRGALLGAAGFELLKLVGTVYIASVSKSPAAGVFGSVLGLLVWFNLVSRFLLFTTAWTATSRSVLAAERRARADDGDDGDQAGDADDSGESAGSRPSDRTARSRRDRDRELVLAREDGPPPGVVLGSLLGAGAVVGLLIPPVVRRWWYAGKPPPRG